MMMMMMMIYRSLNSKVASDDWIYFHFKCQSCN
jgi:hypothetical protein